MGNYEDYEVHVLDPSYRQKAVLTHERVLLTHRAAFARELAKSWIASGAYIPIESTATDQKFRSASPDEIAARTCDVAQALYEQFSTRGWFIVAPTFDSILMEGANVGFAPGRGE